MNTTRRVGVYGGAFDPPHDAHVALVRTAIDHLALDVVHLIPTGDAWHKRRALSPAADRVAMCGLAFGGLPGVEIDVRELQREGPSYTVDTLTELHAEHPGAALFLLIGADQADAFVRWHRANDIVRLATVVIAERAAMGSALNARDPLPGVDLGNAQGVQVLPLEPMAHSSSEVRLRVEHGQNIDHLVPPAVARYIASHCLYQPIQSE